VADIARLAVEVTGGQSIDAVNTSLNNFSQAARSAQQIAGSFKGSTGQFTTSLGGIIVSAKTAQQQMSSLGTETQSTARKMQGTQKDFTDIFRSLLNARDGTEGLIGGFLRLGTGAYLVTRALQTTVGIISGMARPFIENAAAMETMSASYGALLGNKSAGNDMVTYLRNLSTIIPVTMDAMSNGTKTLLGFGFAADEIKDVLPKIAALAMGNSEAFDHLAVVYGQVRAQGKMYMNDLRQFTNAGVPMIEALADVVKAPQSEIGNMIRDGKIGLTQVKSALELITAEGGRFHDTLTAATDTLNGQLTIAANNFKLIFADAGAAPAQWLKEYLKGINTSMSYTRTYNTLWETNNNDGTPEQRAKIQSAVASATQIRNTNRKGNAYDQLVAKAFDAEIVRIRALFPNIDFVSTTTDKNQVIVPEEDSTVSARALERQAMRFKSAIEYSKTSSAEGHGYNLKKELTDITQELVDDLVNMDPKLLKSGEPYYDEPGFESNGVKALWDALAPYLAKKGTKGPKGPKTFSETLADMMDKFRADETTASNQMTETGESEAYLKARDAARDALLKSLESAFEKYNVSGADRITLRSGVGGAVVDFLYGSGIQQEQEKLAKLPSDYGKGNIDLNHRPVAKNEDGYSTVLSFSTEMEGQEVLLPMVSMGGQIMTEAEAIKEYKKTGLYLGKFKSPDEATAYAESLHNSQETLYGPLMEAMSNPNGGNTGEYTNYKPYAVTKKIEAMPRTSTRISRVMEQYGNTDSAFSSMSGYQSTDQMAATLADLQAVQAELLRLKETAQSAALDAPIRTLNEQLRITKLLGYDSANQFLDMKTELVGLAESGAISSLQALGKSLVDGTDASVGLGNAVATALASMLAAIPTYMLRAGLELVMSPDTRAMGIALIIGSGLLSIASGVTNEAVAKEDEKAKATKTGTAYEESTAVQSVASRSVSSTPKSTTVFQLVDQTSRSVSVTAEETMGANGSKQIRAIVKDIIKSSVAGGALDDALGQRYNVRVAGARVS
jgi:tape measure domain-containing protein